MGGDILNTQHRSVVIDWLTAERRCRKGGERRGQMEEPGIGRRGGCRNEGGGGGLEGRGRGKTEGGDERVVCHDVTPEAQELGTSLWILVVRDSFDDLIVEDSMTTILARMKVISVRCLRNDRVLNKCTTLYNRKKTVAYLIHWKILWSVQTWHNSSMKLCYQFDLLHSVSAVNVTYFSRLLKGQTKLGFRVVSEACSSVLQHFSKIKRSRTEITIWV